MPILAQQARHPPAHNDLAGPEQEDAKEQEVARRGAGTSGAVRLRALMSTEGSSSKLGVMLYARSCS